MHSRRWRKASKAHKAEFPLCAECERQGRVTAVAITHHKVPHNGNYELFWDPANWESICVEHHELEHKDERWGK